LPAAEHAAILRGLRMLREKFQSMAERDGFMKVRS
jgi:hypothetical protein